MLLSQAPPTVFNKDFSCPCSCQECRCNELINYVFHRSVEEKKASLFPAQKAPSCCSCGISKEDQWKDDGSHSPDCFTVKINRVFHFAIRIQYDLYQIPSLALDNNDNNDKFVTESIKQFLGPNISQCLKNVVRQQPEQSQQQQQQEQMAIFDLFFVGDWLNQGTGIKYSMKNVLLKLADHPSLVIQHAKQQFVSVLHQVAPMKCMNCVRSITNKLHALVDSDTRPSSLSSSSSPSSDGSATVKCDLDSKTVFLFSDHLRRQLSATSCQNALLELGKHSEIMMDDWKRYLQQRGLSSSPRCSTHAYHIAVSGMKCNGCVTKVSDAVTKIPVVKYVDVDIIEKVCNALCEHEPDEMEQVSELLLSTIRGLNLNCELLSVDQSCIRRVGGQTVDLRVIGMKCGSCVNKVTRALRDQYPNEIGEISVDLNEKRVTILHSTIDASSLMNTLSGLGYICDVIQPDISHQDRIDDDASGSYGTGLQEIVLDNPVEMICSATVSIEGMTCGSCVSKIEDKVKAMPGVKSCEVNLITQKGQIQYDSSRTSERNIIELITNLGYESSSLTKHSQSSGGHLRLLVRNLSAIADQVDHLLNTATGVSKKEMDLESGIVAISFDDQLTCNRRIIDDLKRHHIECSLYKEETYDAKASILRTSEIKKWKHLFYVSLIFTIPTMIISMGLSMLPITMPYMHYQMLPGLTVEALLLFLLVTPVQFYCGWPYFKLAFQALRNRSADMNVLITIATMEAYVYSVFAVIYSMVTKTTNHHYFETSASLIMFLSLGRWMENVAKGQTSSALVALMDLQPSSAVLLENPNKPFHSATVDDYLLNPSEFEEREIGIDLVSAGDMIKVTSGSKIPVDGIVVHGSSSVNEAMITGESLPVFKTVDSKVIGGTINSDGLLIVKASRVGADSTLNTIASLVEQSQMAKPQLQSLADRISGFFVPAVIVLSFITFGVWMMLGAFDVYPASWRPSGMSNFVFSLLLSTATVIIACPCSLGLATPTAVMTGTGVAAKNGILIKGGKALESVAKCTAVLFDKTGTLTKGDLTVTDHKIFDEQYEDSSNLGKLCAWVRAIEGSSEHPIARAVCTFTDKYISNDTPDMAAPSDFVTVPGRGISAIVHGNRVLIGNEAYMQDENIEMTSDHSYNKHSTIVFVAVENRLAMTLLLSDTVREESRAVIATLESIKTRSKPMKVYMLTGDNEFAANHIASQIGIKPGHVFSQLTPGGKCEKVKELQMAGEVVLMVGDGINDSVGLAQADSSVAIGAGTDVAVECADIVLMSDHIEGLITAIDLSRTIYRRIVWNFVWAFGYNVMAIPLAAGVFYPLIQIMIPPWVAGLAMVLSSISVTLSSLALRLYRKPKLVRPVDHETDEEDPYLRVIR